MIVPEFMQFYGYTVAQTLNEYSRTFHSLVNAMYRIQAKQSLGQVGNMSTALAGEDGSAYVSALRKQELGLHQMVKEVRVIKGIKK